MSASPVVPRLALANDSSPAPSGNGNGLGGRTLSMKGRTPMRANDESSATNDLYQRRLLRKPPVASATASHFVGTGMTAVASPDAPPPAHRMRKPSELPAPQPHTLSEMALGTSETVYSLSGLAGVPGGRKRVPGRSMHEETPMPVARPARYEISAPPFAVDLKSGRRRNVPAVATFKPSRRQDPSAALANMEGSMTASSSPAVAAYIKRATAFPHHRDPAGEGSIVKSTADAKPGSFAQKRHFDPNAASAGPSVASAAFDGVPTVAEVRTGADAGSAPRNGRAHPASTSFKPGCRFSPRVGISVKQVPSSKAIVDEPFANAAKASVHTRNVITWKGFSARRKTPRAHKKAASPPMATEAHASHGHGVGRSSVPAAAQSRAAPFDTSYYKSPFAPVSVRPGGVGQRGTLKGYRRDYLAF